MYNSSWKKFSTVLHQMLSNVDDHINSEKWPNNAAELCYYRLEHSNISGIKLINAAERYGRSVKDRGISEHLLYAWKQAVQKPHVAEV